MAYQSYILSSLAKEDIVWLTQAGTKETITTGTAILTEGTASDFLYIVIDGSFAIQIDALNNQTIAHTGPGEVLGEMSFVDNRPSSETVVADGNCQALIIPRKVLREKIETDDPFAKRFYRALAIFMADRLRDTLNPGAHISPSTDHGRLDEILGDLRNA
jgi:CRP/FNR family cyclic AMP-dependent transcriptional regulator